MLKLLETTVESTTTIADILTDPEVDLTKPKETLGYFARLWEEWDLFGKLQDALPKIIFAVILVVIGFLLAHILSKLIVRGMKLKNADFAVYNFIAKMVRFVIRITFLLMAVSMFIKINSIIAALSAVGVAVGLGLQDSVSQFVSGVQILLNHPFRAGDFVEVAGVSGNVAEIGFMTTVIITLDNKRIVMPNSDLTKNHIINCSAEERRRVDLTFSISYSDNIAKAKAIVLDVAKENALVLDDPVPVVYVGAHAASSIELITRVWCLNANYWDVFFSLQEEVKLAFDKNEISIPFDQLDVHIVEHK